MKHLKFVAIVITALLIFSILPTYAQSNAATQNTPSPSMSDDTLSVSRQQLAIMRTAERQNRLLNRSSEALSRATDLEFDASSPYFLVEYGTGLFLTYNISNLSISASSYSSSNNSNQQWYIYKDNSTGKFTFHPASANYYGLSINASTQSLCLQFCQNFHNQEWFIDMDDDDIATIQSADSMNEDYYEKELYYDFRESQWVVESNLGAGFGIFKVSEFAAPSSLTHAPVHLALNQSKYIIEPVSETVSPHLNRFWMYWTSSNSTILYTHADGELTGRLYGVATLFFEDVITGVTGQCSVEVHNISNGEHTLNIVDSSICAGITSTSLYDGAPVRTINDSSYLWTFTIDNETGLYSIKRSASNGYHYYMSVNTTSSSKYIVVKRATGEAQLTSCEKWNIIPAEQGYTLYPQYTGSQSSLCANTSDDEYFISSQLRLVSKPINTSVYETEWAIN